MACYQVQTVSIEFKAGNAALLEKAIAAAGLNIDLKSRDNLTYWLYGQGTGDIMLDLERGTATIPEGQQGTLNALKRAYAAEALKQAAKQNGWTYTATTKSRGELRRTYT